jgi:hypothetical protein
MNKNKILIVFIAILVAIIALWLSVHKTQTTVKPTFYYSDEPRIASSSAISEWTTPKKPVIINTFTQVPDKKFIERIWKDNPYLNLSKALKDNKIDQKYYNYFYDNAEIPFAFEKADLNSDGKLDDYFQSFGVGCVSCRGHLVSMFINAKVYISEIQGDFKPRSDKKGFYTTNEIRNFKIPESDPPNAIEIDRFQWNGNGFTEIGVRTIALYKNPITKNQAEVVK